MSLRVKSIDLVSSHLDLEVNEPLNWPCWCLDLILIDWVILTQSSQWSRLKWSESHSQSMTMKYSKSNIHTTSYMVHHTDYNDWYTRYNLATLSKFKQLFATINWIKILLIISSCMWIMFDCRSGGVSVHCSATLAALASNHRMFYLC